MGRVLTRCAPCVWCGAGNAYRLASRVIECNDSVAVAVQYACGNAVVCDDLKAARCVTCCAVRVSGGVDSRTAAHRVCGW